MPPTPLRIHPIPPDAPITFLAPEYLESLPASPIHPWHPHNDPNTPSFLLLSFSIVVTLQLTIFMQLKCSFSIVVVFNCHHFATDHLHAVKMLIFYCCHFQLLSLCNWPSSGVCPVYNIPSLGVTGTFSVLWSSANFCSISQNMYYKAPVASQHWRPTKWSGHGKMVDHPGKLLFMKDILPVRVTI